MEIQEYIEKYGNNLQEVECCFEMYKSIKLNAESKNDKVNIYSYFFEIILSSLQYAFFLNISKLLVKDEEKNIFKLIQQCKCNKRKIEDYESLEVILNEFEKELDLKQVTIDKIKFLRDKFFAHADATYFFKPDEAFDLAEIKGIEIEELLAILNVYMSKICNNLEIEFNDFKTKMVKKDWDTILSKI